MLRLLTLACLILAASCSAPGTPSPRGDKVLYVVQRDWHTDITLPVDEIAGPLTALTAPGVRYISFGFGERNYLVSRRRDVGTMLNALLPSQSAMLVTTLGGTPQAAFGADNVVVLHVPQDSLDHIEAAIWREFDQTNDGAPLLLDAGPYPGGRYYAARDTYDGLFTCNSWTAETLRAGGIPVPRALFAGQVMGAVRPFSD